MHVRTVVKRNELSRWQEVVLGPPEALIKSRQKPGIVPKSSTHLDSPFFYSLWRCAHADFKSSYYFSLIWFYFYIWYLEITLYPKYFIFSPKVAYRKKWLYSKEYNFEIHQIFFRSDHKESRKNCSSIYVKNILVNFLMINWRHIKKF